MATVLITGGTGLVGTAVTQELLNKNYDVIILTRFPGKQSPAEQEYAHWNPEKSEIDLQALGEADYIIHLAGENLGTKRWSARRKKQIVESRSNSSKLIADALRKYPNKVKAVVSASAIGWYGPSAAQGTTANGRPQFVETDPAAGDFLGSTCAEWEAGIEPVATLGKRLVIFRTGLVLSKEGGALPKFKKPLRFGIAAIMGNGRQVMSWIHIEDLARLYVWAIQNEKLRGTYNAVAPFPVTNRNFVLELARRSKGRFFVPVFVPAFALKLLLGEMSIEVLKSASVSSGKIRTTGFEFFHPTIISAIRELVHG